MKKRLEISTFFNESVFHVYGKIGALEWQHEANYFEYGESNDQEEKNFDRKNAITLMYHERAESLIEESPPIK